MGQLTDRKHEDNFTGILELTLQWFYRLIRYANRTPWKIRLPVKKIAHASVVLGNMLFVTEIDV